MAPRLKAADCGRDRDVWVDFGKNREVRGVTPGPSFPSSQS